jgi:hypothetical protein
MMQDWAESHHIIRTAHQQIYEAMLDGRHEDAMNLLDDIIVATRAMRAWINESKTVSGNRR